MKQPSNIMYVTHLAIIWNIDSNIDNISQNIKNSSYLLVISEHTLHM